MATHSSTLAWKIPWTEEPGRLQKRLHFHFSLSCIGEGNGNPLQHSCLENPRGRGACWAAVYGVTQSWTQLKRLSSSSSSTYHQALDPRGWGLCITTRGSRCNYFPHFKHGDKARTAVRQEGPPACKV